MPITLDGTNGITQAGEFNSDSTFGFKNRIINGAMVIDQRNAGAAVTNVTGAYVLDRWKAAGSTDGAVTIQQVSTAPDGFTKSMKLLVATADTSIAAGQYYQFFQVIEGYNVADLMLGTATAKTFTVSFWVQSSKTGTYCATLTNGASNRLCPVNFTINSANTWEQKSFTVTGDTTGTWSTDNSGGLILIVNLALGSNFNAGTSGTWGTTQYGTSSQVNWLDTVNATFYITGVQLEVGSTATSFDYRPYGTELALCQRYYYKIAQGKVTVGSPIAAGYYLSSTTVNSVISFPVTMRTSPTLSAASGTDYYSIFRNEAQDSFNSLTIDISNENYIAVFNNSEVSGTSGQAGIFFITNNTPVAFVAVSAEL